MFHTIIVEDDPMVASINRQYLQADSHFSLDGSFANGQEALEYLREHPVDLAIVDYYMPLMDGLAFVQACRSMALPLSLIMITAANTPREIMELLNYGVLDYIVKPFTFDRFQQALQKFIHYQSVHQQQGGLDQQEIDRLLFTSVQEKKNVPLVKGIQPQTMERLRSCLQEHQGDYLTSDDISREIGLSRITVRRYLNFMLENHEIFSMMDYTTGGRPCLRYRIAEA